MPFYNLPKVTSYLLLIKPFQFEVLGEQIAVRITQPLGVAVLLDQNGENALIDVFNNSVVLQALDASAMGFYMHAPSNVLLNAAFYLLQRLQ